MQNGYRDVVHRGHWVDGNCPFYDAIAANHSKMDLSIRGHCGFKDASPINVPTGEIVRASRAMAKRNAMGSLQTLKSRRCCDLPALRFVFLFAILGNTVRKSVKGQLSLIHNPKLSEKE